MADENDRTPMSPPMSPPLSPMSDADITPPPVGTSFQPAAPLKDTGVSFDPAADDVTTAERTGTVDAATQTVKEGATSLRDQASDRARLFAEDGKAKATSALGQLTGLLNDAAGQVDEKLGEQYGQYARMAADRVQAFSSSLDERSVDDLFDDARELVKKSPGAAVGVAAALGFVVARLLTAGVDQRDA